MRIDIPPHASNDTVFISMCQTLCSRRFLWCKRSRLEPIPVSIQCSVSITASSELIYDFLWIWPNSHSYLSVVGVYQPLQKRRGVEDYTSPIHPMIASAVPHHPHHQLQSMMISGLYLYFFLLSPLISHCRHLLIVCLRFLCLTSPICHYIFFYPYLPVILYVASLVINFRYLYTFTVGYRLIVPSIWLARKSTLTATAILTFCSLVSTITGHSTLTTATPIPLLLRLCHLTLPAV